MSNEVIYKKKRIVLFCMLLFALICLSGCQKSEFIDPYNDSAADAESIETKDIVIEKRIINISGNTTEELRDQLENMSGDTYEKLLLNDDGSITLKMTDAQRREFRESRVALLEDLKSAVESEADNYTVSWNKDCTEVALYYNLDLDARKAIAYVQYANFLCALYQIANDVSSDSWNVKIGIYNSDTGKLVKEAVAPLESLEYDKSDWENSMQ